MLAVAYEKTQELARDLRAVGCGDLDVEGNEFNLLMFLHFTSTFSLLQDFHL
jgi:hypothetical protein